MAVFSRSKNFFRNLIVHRCVGCGGRVSAERGRFCSWCRVRMYPDGERFVEGIRVLTAFRHEGVVREMILRLKFGGERYLAGPLAGLALASWKEAPGKRDVVVPVPVSSGRLKERGYNQAALLAAAVSKRCGSEYREILARAGGRSQVRVSGSGRAKNISGKFSVVSGAPTGERFWLVDDVMTTGATIAEVLTTLHDAGILNVQPAVVCFRESYTDSFFAESEVRRAGS